MIETSSTFRAPPLLSPRTANYVAALIREGDNFDYAGGFNRSERKRLRRNRSRNEYLGEDCS